MANVIGQGMVEPERRSDSYCAQLVVGDKGREENSLKKSNMKINSSPDVRRLWQIMMTLSPVPMNTRTHLSMSQELGPPVGVASTSIHVTQLRKHADEISKNGGEATRSLCKLVASVRLVHDIICAHCRQIASLEVSRRAAARTFPSPEPTTISRLIETGQAGNKTNITHSCLSMNTEYKPDYFENDWNKWPVGLDKGHELTTVWVTYSPDPTRPLRGSRG